MNGNTNVSIITEFFNSQSTAGDLAGVLSDTSLWFQIVIWIIMSVGAIALGIWILRIAVDIVLIVTRNMGGPAEKMSKFGTGTGDNYASVKKYLAGNLIEIILVILLVFFLISGYLFRLVAFAIDGIGTLGNKLLGLDITGKLSALDAEAFVQNTGSQRSNSLRNQYDDQLSSAKQYANQLYDLAKKGTVGDDPVLQKTKSLYTQAMVKANILGEELIDRGVESDFKLGEGYFRQHLRQSGDGICNEQFLLDDVIQTFSVSGANASISCTR